ncbi:MAG: GNAT family N-acetyltransferase [Faecalibacterium sp.]|nr:GNAT family N-acetyltransferase [Ruminococcus sp.]MCM1391766.1 GNAT family N-acetyltransferase [Ruminococcus sp.]MCM1485046.1 GNAT family N-acetyltransferase [Faecalibacterium sp.]
MKLMIREFCQDDIECMAEIWNEVVEDGMAFPQIDTLNADDNSCIEFFASQSFTGVAVDCDSNKILGLYILHPNNIGRCGHISNASFAVSSNARGLGIGEELVKHCLEKAKELGFGILQFNAVVKTNTAAHRLYNKLGFVELGTVPKGFLMKNGQYEDIVLYYHTL